jgi:glucan phosphoethanolaminetransferase (alkaline phosphatase superfamily)
MLFLSMSVVSIILVFHQSSAIAQNLEGSFLSYMQFNTVANISDFGRYRTTGIESIDIFIKHLAVGLTMAMLIFCMKRAMHGYSLYEDWGVQSLALVLVMIVCLG